MTNGLNATPFAHHQRFPQASETEPQPPFAVELVDYLMAGVVFDRRTVRALVPQSLDLAPRVHGFFATGHAPFGWRITPFSNFYLALAVEGLPSPDGTPAMFRPLNIYSERAGRIFRKYYNSLIKYGTHHFSSDGDEWNADVAADDGLNARLSIRRRPGEAGTEITGVHHYLGQGAGGEVSSFHTSYTANTVAADLVNLTFSGGDPRLCFQPDEITWASYTSRLAITISEPRGSPFAANDPTRRASGLTALLGRIGMAAACVSRDGRLLSANPAAHALLAGVVSGGRVIVRRGNGQMSVDPVLLSGLGQAGQSITVLLERHNGGLPAIAQAFAIGRDLIEEDALLMLFRDPAGKGAVDAHTVLELLGLTPAEARLAAVMGAGNSVAAAAELLGITANTARGALKAVYSKLQIGRQSELARIVARITTGAD